MRFARPSPALFLVVLVSLLAVEPAFSGDVLEVYLGSDVLVGTLSTPAEEDLFPFRAVEGSLLNLVVKAGKGSDLIPDVGILGPDRAPIPGFDEAKQWKGNGSSLKAKKVVLPVTGLYYLVVRPKDGTTGPYEVKSALKAPKKLTLAAEIPEPGGEVVLPIPSPGQATGNVSVAAQRKWTDARGPGDLMPAPGVVVTPGGEVLTVTDAKLGKGKFKLSRFSFDEFGVYQLHVKAEQGTRGGLTAKISGLKCPKRGKRTVQDLDILLPPIVSSLAPVEATVGDGVLSATVRGAFFQPGARIVMVRGTQGVTFSDPTRVDEATLLFDLDVGRLAVGKWHLDVENPDQGRGRLPDAFTVLNVSPRNLVMTPGEGTDGEILSALITGEDFLGGTTARLFREGEEIPGQSTVLVDSSTLSTRFDLRGRTQGDWDLEVTNQGATPTVLRNALRIVNAAPVITAIDPECCFDPDGEIDVVITGRDFESGAEVEIRLAGEAPIVATSVAATSLQITCHLAFEDAKLGKWDVAVTNPDGKEGIKPAAFEVSDPIRVLLLGDNGSEDQVKAALEKAGMLVTDGGLYHQWSPSSASDLEDIDVVLWLEGVDWGKDPTDAADRILEAWIKDGGGLVRTEWSAYDINQSTGPSRLHALMPVTSDAGNYSEFASNTWVVKDQSHALARDLPKQWDESSVGWSEVSAVAAATVVIESSTGVPLLTYRTDVGGTVIHVNHDMTYSSSTIGANALQVLVNCARFVAQQTPR